MSVTVTMTNHEAELIEKALLGIASNAYAGYRNHQEAGHDDIAETHYDRYEEVRLAAYRITEAIDKSKGATK